MNLCMGRTLLMLIYQYYKLPIKHTTHIKRRETITKGERDQDSLHKRETEREARGAAESPGG